MEGKCITTKDTVPNSDLSDAEEKSRRLLSNCKSLKSSLEDALLILQNGTAARGESISGCVESKSPGNRFQKISFDSEESLDIISDCGNVVNRIKSLIE